MPPAPTPAATHEPTTSTTSPQVPATILFATDLSSRCDRALDRALILARQWSSRVVALTVVEPGITSPARPADTLASGWPQTRASALRHAERRLRADLAVTDLPLVASVAQGPVTDSILAVRDTEAAGMIVTGVARNEALSRIVLGSSVDALARRSPVPLLVVFRRARSPYGEVVVASDFSPSSRQALETAAALFPDASFTLFHAFGNPYPTLAGMDKARARNDGYQFAESEARSFLKGCELPQPVRDRMQLALAHGDAGELLRARSASHPDELVVLGTQRRGALVSLLIGSVAQRILEQAENDVLLVPATG